MMAESIPEDTVIVLDKTEAITLEEKNTKSTSEASLKDPLIATSKISTVSESSKNEPDVVCLEDQQEEAPQVDSISTQTIKQEVIEQESKPQKSSATDESINIPIVKPEPSASNLASLVLQSNVSENFELKITSQPTSDNNSQGSANKTPTTEKGEPKQLLQSSMNINPLFLSARARKLLKLKQQAIVNPGSSPSTLSSENSTPIPSEPNPEVPKDDHVNSKENSICQTLENEDLDQTQNALQDPKKKTNPKPRKKKEMVFTNSLSRFFPTTAADFSNSEPAPTFTPLQPKIFSVQIYEDMDPKVLDNSVALPSLEQKALLEHDSSILSLDQYARLLSVSEFLRISANQVVEDWPSILCDPKIIELSLYVPSSKYCAIFSYIVSFLLRCTKFQQIEDFDELTCFIDLPKALNDSINVSNFDLKSSSPLDKLNVLCMLIDHITQQSWFIRYLENLSSLSNSNSQKKRDLSIKYDSIKFTSKKYYDDLLNAQRRFQFIETQHKETPENELLNLQMSAVSKQIAEIETRIESFKKSEADLMTKIQELTVAEFGSANNALIHGQLKGPISEGYVNLIGKDRLGRFFWFWKSVGGILIETSPDALSLPDSTFSHWILIDDVLSLDLLIQSLNPKGTRELKLLTNINSNKEKIINSFPNCQKWKEMRSKLIELASDDDKMSAYLFDEFSSFNLLLSSEKSLNESLGCFNIHLKSFGLSQISELSSLTDESKYFSSKLNVLKDRLRKVKSYLFDQSAILVENADTIKTSQLLLNSLETVSNLEQAVKLTHQMIDLTVPILEDVKSLDVPLTKREKGLKRSLAILLTWIKTSSYFKDLLTAVTTSPEEKFPSIDLFCSWLKSVIDYLVDLHQEDIENDAFIPLSQKKFQGIMLKNPCTFHNSKETAPSDSFCHYHAISLPSNKFIGIHIPKSENVYSEGNQYEYSSEDAISTRRNRSRALSKPKSVGTRNKGKSIISSNNSTPRRSTRSKNVVNYKLDPLNDIESPEDSKDSGSRSSRTRGAVKASPDSDSSDIKVTPSKRALRNKSQTSKTIDTSDSDASIDEPPSKLLKSEISKPTKNTKITDFVKSEPKNQNLSERNSSRSTPRKVTLKNKIKFETDSFIDEDSEPVVSRRSSRMKKSVTYKVSNSGDDSE